MTIKERNKSQRDYVVTEREKLLIPLLKNLTNEKRNNLLRGKTEKINKLFTMFLSPKNLTDLKELLEVLPEPLEKSTRKQNHENKNAFQ